MNPAETIRARALALLVTDDLEVLEKAAELLKAASEIEQLEESAKDTKKHWRGLLAASTPLITTAILAGTLAFQIYQSRQAENEKRAETVRLSQQAEQTRFTDALKALESSEKISTAATLLNTFATEPQKSEARQMALKLLLRARSFDEFQDLFSATIDPVTPSDMPAILLLDRSIYNTYGGLPSGYDPVSKKTNWSKLGPSVMVEHTTLVNELDFLSTRIALLLKRGIAVETDLSNSPLSDVDLAGADLRGTNLLGTIISSVNLDGCDMSRITSFQDAKFYFTAWWHAAHIDRPLLRYLERTAPYHEGTAYFSKTPVTADDYKSNVARLESSAS